MTTNANTIPVSATTALHSVDRLIDLGCLLSPVSGSSAVLVTYPRGVEQDVVNILGGYGNYGIRLVSFRAPTDEEIASDSVVSLAVDV